MPEPPRRPPAARSVRPGPVGRSDRRQERRRRMLRRRRLAAAILLCAVVLAVAGFGAWWGGTSDGATDAAPAPPATPAPTAPATATPTPTEEAPVLALSGNFPDEGPGTFRFATGEGEVLGEAGTLMRYRLAVEESIEEDLDALAAFVDATLGGDQGWTTGGQHRFQRVPDGAPHELTIHLATSRTTGQMCGSAGLNVLAPSLPDGGVSCYYSGRVVLNLARWRLSVSHYVDAQVPLETYRQMVLNHEVGHALGLGHEACPGQGEPAPVMQQQTIDLDGCEAYAWPYRDGQRYAGEPVP